MLNNWISPLKRLGLFFVVPLLLLLLVSDLAPLTIEAGPFKPQAPSGGTEDSVPRSTGPVTFTGNVNYDPDAADSRAQRDVPVTLFGISGAGAPVELDSATSGPDGAFELTVRDPSDDEFRIVVGNPRGFVPGYSEPSGTGFALDPNTVAYPGSVSGVVSDTQFVLHDPTLKNPLHYGRYLIVTRAAVVPMLDDFIAYKQSLGFDVVVKTVEALDPGGIGGNYLRNQIRAYEQSLWFTDLGLSYVLLIGTHDTVPFLLVNAVTPDRVRLPADAFWKWDGHCAGYGAVANICGRATDWYYVDLASNWDSNGDGVIGEAFWANPDKIQKWKNDGILEQNFQPDNPPEFNTNVMVGRLLIDSPLAVEGALRTIMGFEQDGSAWKRQTLLAGAMLSVGGRTWDGEDNEYKELPAPTDTGYLMEDVWDDFLAPGGYSRIRLYEKESPYGVLAPRTSGFAVDDPLTIDTLSNWWTSQAFGLVKISGHGSPDFIVRHIWREDENSNYIPEDVISPDEGVAFPFELSHINMFSSDLMSQLSMPGGKTPVLIALSCSTGGWYASSNMATELMVAGKISGWVGGTDKLYYVPGWQNPLDSTGGRGQTIDYLITGHLMDEQMPLGDAVWTGLKDYYWWADVPNWSGKDINLGFLTWELYGDPSMTYWGNGADTTAPWPMFQYDWPGGSETALLGPDGLETDGVEIRWSEPISAPLTGGNMPSPVIGRNGVIVIGDGNGVVHAFDPDGTELWSYQTGGAIANAAALSRDGTVYVKSGDGKLYAIDGQGTVLWSKQVGEGVASPKVNTDGTIYVGGSDYMGVGRSKRYYLAGYRPDGTLRGLSQIEGAVTTAPSIERNGRSVWIGTSTGRIYWLAVGLIGFSMELTPGSPIGNGLALSNDHELLVVPSTNGSVIGVDTSTLQVSWVYSTTAPVYSAPALGANDQVFVGSGDGKLYALDLTNGDELWSYDIGGTIDSSPALDPLNVYVVGGDPAAVYAIRRSDGTYRWSVPLGGTAEGGSSPAIGASRVLYVAAPSTVGGGAGDGTLVALAQTSWVMPPFIQDVIPAREQIEIDLGLGDPLAITQMERRVAGGEWQTLGRLGPGVSKFIDNNVSPGQTYEYRAIAYPFSRSPATPTAGTALEPSDYSAAITVQALPALPQEPPMPVVTPLSSTGLHLTWTPEITDAINLEVVRQNPGETATETIALLPGGVFAYDDTDLEPASEYHYWLRAINSAGQSPTGKRGSGTTLSQTLPPPENVVVNPLDLSTMEVCWTPGDDELFSVVARRTTGLTELEYLEMVGPGETCFTDEFAFNYMFEYWIKHRNEAGTDESEWARSALTASPGFDLGYHNIYLPLVLRK